MFLVYTICYLIMHLKHDKLLTKCMPNISMNHKWMISSYMVKSDDCCIIMYQIYSKPHQYLEIPQEKLRSFFNNVLLKGYLGTWVFFGLQTSTFGPLAQSGTNICLTLCCSLNCDSKLFLNTMIQKTITIIENEFFTL